jgi:Arc/MetJ-type ribon-helix-helix transcriptional regulator
MTITVELDPKQLHRAVRIGKFQSASEAINAALAEYVKRHGQAAILDMAGKITYHPDYDHKQLRGRRK